LVTALSIEGILHFVVPLFRKERGEILLKPSLHNRLIPESKKTPNGSYYSIKVSELDGQKCA
jgi:hypothetical protein